MVKEKHGLLWVEEVSTPEYVDKQSHSIYKEEP